MGKGDGSPEDKGKAAPRALGGAAAPLLTFLGICSLLGLGGG